MDCAKVESFIVGWLRRMVASAHSSGLVFGLSGGIDSAVVAALCKKAMGDSTLALIMPCESHPIDFEHAVLTAEAFDIKRHFVELTGTYRSMVAEMNRAGMKDPPRMASANLKPRLRMATLYYFANGLNYMVAGTGNRSEWYVGYSTKFGDGGVDIQPILGLLKSEVVELAGHLGVPKEIIEKPPTAGLWQGQTDESEMGFTYDQLDRYISTGEAEPAVKERIDRMNMASRHKYMPPPTPFSPEDGIPAMIPEAK
ncbi:MAG TPA: NAD(+) synthase [Bacillota bacterium]|nr:NAD(+) synthase [Bacillota bacterium]HOH09512.1 NAD(+) synthase [Bacillota bacterium]HOS49978.1 NAD(+) synthase [Bacillota bacterium]HQJ24376.1 NAD(+) synthase [Bacillota bacterium]